MDMQYVQGKPLFTYINIYGNKCDYIKRDTLLYTAKKDEVNAIKIEYDLRKENGLDVEYIDENNKRYSFDLKAGIISKNGGAEIDPYKYTHELLEVALSNGASVYENTEVVDLTLMCESLPSSISGRWIALNDSQQE